MPYSRATMAGCASMPPWSVTSAAARAKATVGEISNALEKVFGRHAGQIRIISGVYSDEAGRSPAVTRARELVDEFAEQEPDGHAIRIWVFCGDRERCNRYVSPDRLVKGPNVVRREPVPVPDDLRARRRDLGFEYGKFDFVVYDGRSILLDANRTPSPPPTLHRETRPSGSAGSRR